MQRPVGRETKNGHERREREGFYRRYLAGDAVLDIGYRGADPANLPVTETAIGIELDYPGYNGIHLPFESNTQDSVYASHCLEHIEDYRLVLADWHRVLKIGGFLIIAVPHRDLYERKPTLPSRFNSDHRRFYTPASLLNEIEESLPTGTFRIRSLKDVDDGFDYTVLPNHHAKGCFEIELVIEKLAAPIYVDLLRPTLLSRELTAFFVNLVTKAIVARKLGQEAEARQVVSFLKSIELPTYAAIRALVNAADAKTTDKPTIDDVKILLTQVVVTHPFDEDFYIKSNKDVALVVAQSGKSYAHSHYINHGYFEGRLPRSVSATDG